MGHSYVLGRNARAKDRWAFPGLAPIYFGRPSLPVDTCNRNASKRLSFFACRAPHIQVPRTGPENPSVRRHPRSDFWTQRPHGVSARAAGPDHASPTDEKGRPTCRRPARRVEQSQKQATGSEPESWRLGRGRRWQEIPQHRHVDALGENPELAMSTKHARPRPQRGHPGLTACRRPGGV